MDRKQAEREIIWKVENLFEKKQQQPSRFNAMHLLYGNLNIKYSYNWKACEHTRMWRLVGTLMFTG